MASPTLSSAPSFRGDAKHRTRNLEIPGLALSRHPGMTVSAGTSAQRRASRFCPAMTKELDQILPCDDLAKPRIVGNEFLDEFVHPVLEYVIHIAVFQPVSVVAGLTMRRIVVAV